MGGLWRVTAPEDTRSVRERLAPDHKALRSCAATIKPEHRIKKLGIQVEPPHIDKWTRQIAHVRVAESNHYQGQMFAEGIYLRWKSMNFHERMIEKIEN